jgi:long-chain fatty acid transport protein
MEQGNRLDVSLGFLGPNVTAKAPPAFGAPDAKSSADAFYMPAIGWVQKRNQLTYGVGVFSQGGMGTEYDANSFMAAGSGETVRSEVGVGRLIAPLAYNVNSQWTIGGSLDFVWAGMDLQMAMGNAQFMDLVTTKQYGEASGSLVETLGGFVQNGLVVNYGYFDFSNSSAFTGEATGTGFAGKIGATFNLNKQWTFGATYHTKTSLSDLEASGAKVTINADATAFFGPGYESVPMELTGDIKVKDFEWPATFGIGAAFQANEKWMIVADIKRIMWADVMENFKMSFTADQSSSNDFSGNFGPNADMRGKTMDATLFQNWEDQTVFEIGAGVGVTDKTTLRFGYNYAQNPIPDKYLNALFPAIVENHLTGGIGYDIDKSSGVDFSLVYAPEVEATSGQGVTSTHSQINWQLMYSYVF